jgi:hypothetical protein
MPSPVADSFPLSFPVPSYWLYPHLYQQNKRMNPGSAFHWPKGEDAGTLSAKKLLEKVRKELA